MSKYIYLIVLTLTSLALLTYGTLYLVVLLSYIFLSLFSIAAITLPIGILAIIVIECSDKLGWV